MPGPWLVAALEPLGIPAATVRQSLARLVQRGDLVARRQGRVKHYALSDLARGFTDTGSEKIFSPPPADWDRRWTLVHYRFEGEQRAARDQVREILEIEGFGMLGRGLFLHPRDRVAKVEAGLAAAGCGTEVAIFRSRWARDEPEQAVAARVWDLDALATAYREHIDRFAPLLRRRPSPAEAFGLRLALVLSYLHTAWDDPDLPHELLPRRWPGHRARELTATLYRRWLDDTLRHGDALLERTDSGSARSSSTT